jgi:hypothetical protein
LCPNPVACDSTSDYELLKTNFSKDCVLSSTLFSSLFIVIQSGLQVTMFCWMGWEKALSIVLLLFVINVDNMSKKLLKSCLYCQGIKKSSIQKWLLNGSGKNFECAANKSL